MTILPFNKVCAFEDFENPAIRSEIETVFGHKLRLTDYNASDAIINTHYWNTAMTLLALKHFGALQPRTALLGVGAGLNELLFYLANQGLRMLAVDLYSNPAAWVGPAPAFMLSQPELIAPYDFARDHLSVQHMDTRALNFPDESFDAIVSPYTIHHFDDMASAANAAYEIGRVLKPEGITAISTQFLIKGPPGEVGWPSGLVFSRENLIRYIVEASGLEPVDEVNTHISPQTMTFQRDLTPLVADFAPSLQPVSPRRYIRMGGLLNPAQARLVIVKDGFVFTSVHLTLKKTQRYPASDNVWARPDQDTYRAIQDLNCQHPPTTKLAGSPQASPSPDLAQAVSSFQITTYNRQSKLNALMEKWDALSQKLLNAGEIRWVPKPLRFVLKTLIRVRYLGVSWNLQSQFFQEITTLLNSLSQEINRKNDF